MDLLKLIRENSAALAGTAFETGVAAVIRHVERAEMYLLKGRKDKDSDYFNDVIYRTNQAYEGMLKESYALLAGKDGTKLRTAELEKYFTEKKVLTTRVAEALQKYRQDWRNPSTHDHRMQFSEQDATLALSNVSTFVYLLVDQMIETSSSEKQKALTTKGRHRKNIKTRGLSVAERVADALVDHALTGALGDLSTRNRTRAVEIVGAISGHLSVLLPDLIVEQDPVLRRESFSLRPDLVVRNGETVVIEVKMFHRAAADRIFQGFATLERYLQVLEAKEGVLYLVPLKAQEDMVTIAVVREINQREVTLYLVTPPSLIANFDEVLNSHGWQPKSPSH